MVAKLFGTVLSSLVTLVGGFVALMVAVKVAAPDKAGAIKDQAIGLVSFVAAGVVDLLQALGSAVMGAL